jgi:hypothetical protein
LYYNDRSAWGGWGELGRGRGGGVLEHEKCCGLIVIFFLHLYTKTQNNNNIAKNHVFSCLMIGLWDGDKVKEGESEGEKLGDSTAESVGDRLPEGDVGVGGERESFISVEEVVLLLLCVGLASFLESGCGKKQEKKQKGEGLEEKKDNL